MLPPALPISSQAVPGGSDSVPSGSSEAQLERLLRVLETALQIGPLLLLECGGVFGRTLGPAGDQHRSHKRMPPPRDCDKARELRGARVRECVPVFRLE